MKIFINKVIQNDIIYIISHKVRINIDKAADSGRFIMSM